jgi:hypothetical protein
VASNFGRTNCGKGVNYHVSGYCDTHAQSDHYDDTQQYFYNEFIDVVSIAPGCEHNRRVDAF